MNNLQVDPSIAAYTAADAFASAGVKNVDPFTGIAMPFPLRDYQSWGLNDTLLMPRYGLYFEPRLGKSIVFLLNALYCAHYGVKTIILSPPVLFGQLQEEWALLDGNPHTMMTFNQGPKTREKLIQGWQAGGTYPDVLVMTKEIFLLEWLKLSQLWYQQIIWDECHLGLQKSTTKIYDAVMRFINRPDYRIILSTGTPIYTTAVNCYPLISFTNPQAYQNEGAFDRMHVTTKKIKVMNRRRKEVEIDVPDKAINLDMLHRNLYVNARRVTRVGHMNMKAPDISVQKVNLPPKHMSTYTELVKSKVLEVGGRMIDARQSAKLRQVAMQIVMNPAEYTHPPLKQNRMMETALQIIDEYPKETRAVLVVNYRQSVETVRDYLLGRAKSKGPWDKPCVIYGGNSAAANKRSADGFKSGKHQFVVLNPDSGGVGLKFGDVCDLVIFLEPVSSYGKFDQVVSRVLLVDKKRPVSVYVLAAQGTLWERNVKNMLDRTAQLRIANQSSDDLMQEMLGK